MTWFRHLQLTQHFSRWSTTYRHFEKKIKTNLVRLHWAHVWRERASRDWIKIEFIYEIRFSVIRWTLQHSRIINTFWFRKIKTARSWELKITSFISFSPTYNQSKASSLNPLLSPSYVTTSVAWAVAVFQTTNALHRTKATQLSFFEKDRVFSQVKSAFWHPDSLYFPSLLTMQSIESGKTFGFFWFGILQQNSPKTMGEFRHGRIPSTQHGALEAGTISITV